MGARCALPVGGGRAAARAHPGAAEGPRPGSAQPSSRAPRPHPFAADPETIAGALASLGGAVTGAARQAAADELTVWLPSAPDGPQAAPELIRPPAEAAPTAGRRCPALGCWRVPALAVEPLAARGVLAALDRLAAPGAPLAAGTLDAAGSEDPMRWRSWPPGDRWPTGPRWPGSRMTWPPGAGCCPPWCRRAGPAGRWAARRLDCALVSGAHRA